MVVRKSKICKYKNCNLEFTPKYSTQKYCSYECYWKSMKGKSSPHKLPRETRICALLGCCNTFECARLTKKISVIDGEQYNIILSK